MPLVNFPQPPYQVCPRDDFDPPPWNKNPMTRDTVCCHRCGHLLSEHWVQEGSHGTYVRRRDVKP